MNRKGQIWSIDVTSAMVMVAVILLFSMFIWNDLAIRWNSTSDYRRMQTDALFATESLMTTPGIPEGWGMLPEGNWNVSAIGLVDSRNELNNLKIRKLEGMDQEGYRLVKARLGVQRYELGIRISDLDNNETYHEFGNFSTMLKDSVAFRRLGLLNGTPVYVFVEVWK